MVLIRFLRALAEVIRSGEPFAFEDDWDDDPFLSAPASASSSVATV